ncbi:PREDICTED: histone-lysine N-methyltransferase ASHH2-like [Tarenaya hassleriana]|uniref:histone-lysine N-methyltransferase ASHH2-like n=1 Tax=Tarenaya hassleriana TaxID=28532 RepID=UPI00053C4C55|nr:PREDICTED: histone-lysine N-methyltransferase ASHH2-like [Tarenaya hassleriana]
MIDLNSSPEVEQNYFTAMLPCSGHGHDLVDSAVNSNRWLGSDCLNPDNVMEMLKDGRKEAKTELRRGFRSGLKNYLKSSVVNAPEVHRDRSSVDKETLITSSQDSELAPGLRREQRDTNSIDGLLMDRERDFLHGSEDGHCSWMEEDACRIEALDFANQCLVQSDFPEILGKGANAVLLSDDRVSCAEPIDDEDNQCDEAACFSGQEADLSGTWTRSRMSELSGKSRMKKVCDHWGKNLKAQQSQESPDSISRAAKRKRSHSSKLARSSQWGLSRYMSQFYCRTQEHVSDKDPNQCSQRYSGAQVDRRSCSHPNGEDAPFSSEQNQASKACIRLKVKFSKSGLENKLIVKHRDINGDSLDVVKHDSKDLKCHKFSQQSARDAADMDISPPSNVASSSPGSEVINSLPFVDVGAKDQDDLCSTVLIVSEAELENWSRGRERRMKVDSHKCTEMSIAEIVKKESRCSSPSLEASSNLSTEEDQSCELFPLLEETRCEVSMGTQKIPDLDPQFPGPQSSRKVLSSCESEGQHSSKSVKSEEGSNGRRECLDYWKGRKKMKSGYIKNQQKLVKHSKDEKDACDPCLEKVKLQHREVGCHRASSVSRADTKDYVASLNVTTIGVTPNGVVEKLTPSDIAWVQCDECFKWRRVTRDRDYSTSLICTDNSDEAFADCSVPQELSDEGISAELVAYEGDSKLSKVAKVSESRKKPAPKTPFFRGIKCNQFLHRSRKAQTIDEVLVCQCKAPPCGRLGCGDDCLNRMLKIECVQSTCPCGDNCSNQQFQQRKYAKVELFNAGKKGHGLRVLEDVCEGHFIIEYVGEVLDGQAYESRLNDYAAQGQRHFYFMTLNANEVIDAGAKGNLGRFINHSCYPNCRTEKWMVNGEICIGIFALRDIKKEEELTFDYNYVRVFGAAGPKCYCGSSRCRGYIGGDLLDRDVIVKSDSDEVHILEDDISNPVTRNSPFNYAEVKLADELRRETEEMIDHELEVYEVVAHPEPDDSMDHFAPSSSQVEYLEDSSLSPVQPQVGSLPLEVVTKKEIIALQSDTYSERETICPTLSQEVASPALESKLFCDVDPGCSKSFSVEDGKYLQKSSRHMETIPCFSLSREERKGKNSSPDGRKFQTSGSDNSPTNFVKHKTLCRGCSNRRIETAFAVESKLTELLDSDGGISKRKDATKGYLQLLLLTAGLPGVASKEGIQSNRDISMVLDALLKTRSRAVLMDIVNRNGLQMLHNTIKQYKNDFKKIPILRKILKVLEYLTVRDILTLEDIIRAPPCLGMESFQDSLLSLTEHDDKQVHQIARNFRDRWNHQRFRGRMRMNKVESMKGSCRHRDYSRFPASHGQTPDPVRSSESITSAPQPKPETPSSGNKDALETEPGNCQTTVTGTRKRKTRWDQPTSKHDLHSSPSREVETRPKSSTPSCLKLKHEAVSSKFRNQNVKDGSPPGFECPLDRADIALAHPQEKFISPLPVSYGIPLAIVQRFAQDIPEETCEKLAIAPGMPFHPFPPLPSIPRDRKHLHASSSLNSTRSSNQYRREPEYPGDHQRPIRSEVNRVAAMDASSDLLKRRRGYWFDQDGNRFQAGELERNSYSIRGALSNEDRTS